MIGSSHHRPVTPTATSPTTTRIAAPIRMAAELVAPTGLLIYATCSVEAEENEQVRAAVQKIVVDPPEMSEGTCLAEYSDSDTSWTTVDALQKLLDSLSTHDWIKGIPGG